MDRRSYLGVIVAGALAGCGDLAPETDTSAETEETPEEEPDTEDEPESADEETPTETAPDDTDDSDDADDTPEPTEDERIASERIEAGDELLGEAIRTYTADVATDPSDEPDGSALLDVRSSRTRFRWVPVANRVREANERFDRAHDRANDDQRERIRALRNVGSFLRESARVQAALGETFEAFGSVLIAHQGDSVGTAAWNRLRDRVEVLTPRVERLREVSDPDAAAESVRLSVEVYRRKVDQLDDEHDALVRVADSRQSFTTAHRAWLDAEQAYRSRSWSRAGNGFETARTEFGAAADRLDRDPVDDDRFDSRYRTFTRIARTLADAAVEYEASARAYGEWASRGRDRTSRREEGDERRRAGRRILREEDAVTEIPSVRRLENYDGPS